MYTDTTPINISQETVKNQSIYALFLCIFGSGADKYVQIKEPKNVTECNRPVS